MLSGWFFFFFLTLQVCENPRSTGYEINNTVHLAKIRLKNNPCQKKEKTKQTNKQNQKKNNHSMVKVKDNISA